MKKYVKPLMESEAFVANEYVSACWTVECSNCGAYSEGYEVLKGQVTSYSKYGITEAVYPGDLDKNELGEIGKGTHCKSLDIEKGEPEASIIKPATWGPWIEWFIITQILDIKWIENTANYHSTATISSGWTHSNHPNASI